MTQEEFNSVDVGDKLLYTREKKEITIFEKLGDDRIKFFDGRFVTDDISYFELLDETTGNKKKCNRSKEIDELIDSCEKAIDFIRAPKHYVGKWPFGRMEDDFTEEQKNKMVEELITKINKIRQLHGN